MRARLAAGVIALWASCFACNAVTSAALEGVDFAGAKADAHCDRRFVEDGGTPAPFCQEIANTVAATEFADDCRSKHHAAAGPGPCPRERIIAGCKLLEHHGDDSIVWDWYYDVSDIIADSGSTNRPLFEDGRPLTERDVAATCADTSRYESGAELAKP